jgi:hypothetical protein
MFSVTISTLSESEKKVLKFKRLFYAQGTEVFVIQAGISEFKLAGHSECTATTLISL